ncbi:MAG: ureidoglycolate lyase [Acidobacteria bacterium]|nr:ureidoglycolate lyase [Acidobacteriota bacterium]
MKLLRYGQKGTERQAVQAPSGDWVDATEFVAQRGGDYNEEFFSAGGVAGLREWMSSQSDLHPLDLAGVRIGAPIARPSKIIGVGLNYREHAAETGSDLPNEPKIFMKATTAMSGVFDDVVLPPGSESTDYEVELAVVIGRTATRVAAEQALESIAGFTICIDYSERDWQKNRSGQFVKGKSADTFAPLGPCLVTPDELRAEDVRLWLAVNGEPRQDSRTSEMIFGVSELVASISGYMTLLPGDVITTGTPTGVGLGLDPPQFLRAGDRLEFGIEGIGEGIQSVVASA